MSYNLPYNHQSLPTFDFTWCVLHLSFKCCLGSTNLSAVLLKKKTPPGQQYQQLCVLIETQRKESERERCPVLQVRMDSVLRGSLGQSFCPLSPFPSKCNRVADGVGSREKKGGIYSQSTAHSLFCGTWYCKPDQLSHWSLFLTRLFWALPTSIRLLWSLTFSPIFLYLFLLFFICPFNAISSVWTLGSFLWPVVQLAAFTACALISGRGSWLGMSPFGNLLMLRNTGCNVVHPCFQILLCNGIDYKHQLTRQLFHPTV